MRPDFLLLLLLSLSSSLFPPSAAVCVPRSSADQLLHHFLPPPTPTSSPSPTPTPTSTPISSPPPPTTPTSSPPPPTPTPQSSPPPPPTPQSFTPTPPTPTSESTGGGPIISLSDIASKLVFGLKSFTPDPSLTSLCDKTDYPDVCQASIIALTNSLGPVNASTALTLQIKACTDLARMGQEKIHELVSDPKIDAVVKSCLDDCFDGFDDAFDNLETANKAMLAGDSGTMNSMLSALFSNFGQCSDGFKEMGITTLPMDGFEKALNKLASNCLAIGDLI